MLNTITNILFHIYRVKLCSVRLQYIKGKTTDSLRKINLVTNPLIPIQTRLPTYVPRKFFERRRRATILNSFSDSRCSVGSKERRVARKFHF